MSKTIAATRVAIKPGGLRAMHWHPNADEWLYVVKGTGRMAVFNTGPAAMTANFHFACDHPTPFLRGLFCVKNLAFSW